MTNKELNKEMAEFAGFKYADKQVWVEDHYEPVEPGWEYPDGSWHRTLPNFPSSPNACVKHLRPRFDFSQIQFYKDRAVVWLGKSLHQGTGFAPPDEPALAFCLAVRDLRKNQKESDGISNTQQS